MNCANKAALVIDWTQLRTDTMPQILVGWTPELAANLVAAIGSGEQKG